VKKILILTANPVETTKLRLDEEVREIQEGLQRSRRRESFEIIPRLAIRQDDLRRALLDHEPHIVHFSGHGVGSDGLMLENDDSTAKLVSTEALARLFALFSNRVECVLLNACYSEVQAAAIHQHIDYVIGMNRAIGDRAAIKFAMGFYDGLGAGRGYGEAFEFGLTGIDLEGLPEVATPVLKQRGAEANTGTETASAPQGASARIFLSYKRGVAPDEPVALDIYHALRQQHTVFIDQTMAVGTPWVETITQEIQRADVLIVLLSEQSLHSEMVQEEIELAQAAPQQTGQPRIFPVRLAYRAPFPYPLNQYLDPLQWAFWEGAADTPALIEALTGALAGRPLPLDTEAAKQKLLQQASPQSLMPPTPLAQLPSDQLPSVTLPLDPPEGSMGADSAFYIERAEDEVALTALARPGGTVTILGPRQMGKSSLLIRAVHQARQRQKRIALLDFQQLETAALTDGDVFYRQFCEWMTVRLRLPSQVEQFWQQFKALGNPLRCTYYVQDYLLATVEGSIFLAMDEVDKLIAAPFRDEFFSMLRSWHNERAFEPAWKQLDLAMVTCTEPYQLIQDLNQSPFNVGTSITLKDFSAEQMAELNRRHGGVLDAAGLHSLMDWVGGHPYLTRKALYEVARRQKPMAAVFDVGAADAGPFGGHLRYHLFRMHNNGPLVRGMVQVIRQRTCDDEQVLRRLEKAGLVRQVGRQVQPRCRLYAEYFKEHLHE
jgi:hypothetical protein